MNTCAPSVSVPPLATEVTPNVFHVPLSVTAEVISKTAKFVLCVVF